MTYDKTKKLVYSALNAEAFERAMDLLSNGYDKTSTELILKEEFPKMTAFKVGCAVHSVWESITQISPTEALDTYALIKTSLMAVLRQANEFYERARTPAEEAEALKIKLKTLAQMRDLIPRQYQLHSVETDIDDTKRLLFEIHNIHPDDVLIDGDE